MPTRLAAVAFDAHDPGAVGAFWSSMLDRRPVQEIAGVLLPGDHTQVGLRFVAASSTGSGAPCLHLHLTSDSREDQQQIVARALGLGGSHLDVGQLPEEDHIVLADPGGNAFCVIEAGNGFLAGCGPLGEVACDGSRAVGLFWADALGWPLVWDEGDETAVQSPLGGTKVAWGGAADVPKQGRNRQRLDLQATDLTADVERLVTLGATRLGDSDGMVELADPDGNEFSITSR